MIKLCGIRRDADIDMVNAFLPDYVGFVLADGFRRTVDIGTAKMLCDRLSPRIKRVGVFVDTDTETVKSAVEKLSLDVLQLHGNEDEEYINLLPKSVAVWKAVRVKSAEDIIKAQKLPVGCLLLDSFVKGRIGGTGATADWEIIKNAAVDKNFFLAGGINADNLSEALEILDNVDISSGFETDGVKDKSKLEAIMKIYNERKNHNE